MEREQWNVRQPWKQGSGGLMGTREERGLWDLHGPHLVPPLTTCVSLGQVLTSPVTQLPQLWTEMIVAAIPPAWL